MLLHYLVKVETPNTGITAGYCQTRLHHMYNSFIAARRSYASAVLGVVILSVCLSVRLSVCHTLALRLIQRTYRRYFYTT